MKKLKRFSQVMPVNYYICKSKKQLQIQYHKSPVQVKETGRILSIEIMSKNSVNLHKYTENHYLFG